jgi:hypothetical protein
LACMHACMHAWKERCLVPICVHLLLPFTPSYLVSLPAWDQPPPLSSLPCLLSVPRLQLLHLCLLNADSRNPAVRRESQALLVYLLYSLSLKHLEAAQVGLCWVGWGGGVYQCGW